MKEYFVRQYIFAFAWVALWLCRNVATYPPPRATLHSLLTGITYAYRVGTLLWQNQSNGEEELINTEPTPIDNWIAISCKLSNPKTLSWLMCTGFYTLVIAHLFIWFHVLVQLPPFSASDCCYSHFLPRIDIIDRCFNHDTVEEIIEALVSIVLNLFYMIEWKILILVPKNMFCFENRK